MDADVDKRVEVCKLKFWDGTKYILKVERTMESDWRELKEQAILSKQPEFSKLLQERKLPAETQMVKVIYTTMKEKEYNAIPASPEIAKLQKAIEEKKNAAAKDKS